MWGLWVNNLVTKLISFISFFIWTKEQEKELKEREKLGCLGHVTMELIWH